MSLSALNHQSIPLPLTCDTRIIDCRRLIVWPETISLQRSQLNYTRSPTCGPLPSELLAEIFSFVAANPSERPRRLSSSYSARQGHRRLGWIRVTHVCRHWRTTAVNHPFLWANIIYELGPRWTKLSMERAKLAPISLCQPRSIGSAIQAEEQDYIPQNIDHIIMLKLRGDGEDLARILHALIGRLAPRLQTLVLHRNLSWYEEDDDQLSDTLPHNLFDGEVPKLRYLHLECLSPNWSSFFHAPNLSVLKIRLDSSQESQTLPTPDQLLDVLERMPKLTTLEIHCAVPEYPSQPALHERLVNLSRLHVLSFHGDYMHCLSLLRNLSLPVDAFICLRLLPRSISPTPYADIFREVALYLQKSFAHTGPIRRLSITGEGEESNDTYLEFLAIIPSKCHLTYEPRTYFKLMFHLEDDETYSWNTFEMIYDYCLTMPLQAVRQLELLVPELELVRLDYIDMFSPMKNLVFLSICGPSAIELPHVLKTSIASQRRATPDTDSIDPWGAMRVEGPRELMFPKLISLKFSSYNFQDGDGPSFVVGLQRALEHRRSTLGRKPLKRLTFDNCFFADDEWVPKVRECVEKLFYPDNFLDSEYGDEFTVLDDYQESE